MSALRAQSLPYALPDVTPAGEIDIFAGRAVSRRSVAELLADVRRAQARLSSAGLARGDAAGLMGENCYEWIVYDLALTSMGCITVAFPEAAFGGCDFGELAEAYELSLLLVTGRFAREKHPWIMLFDEDGEQPSVRTRRLARGEIHALARDHDLCAVIFSSGSSGDLKAIALAKAGVEHVLDGFAEAFGLGPGDRVFVALPLSIFQQRVLIYSALRTGADICFTNPLLLFHGLAALSPSVVLAPPSLFEAIEDRGYDRARLEAAFGGRPRLLLTGSAPSRFSTLAFYEAAGFPIFQIYGMAEIGFVAWNRPGANRPRTVGRPVVPGSVEIAPDGEILFTGRRRQAIGYLGAARTQQEETFLADGRVATGDLGAFDSEGHLVITGRKKDIIVTRSGRKFAIHGLEAALEAIAGVERAVVLGGGDLPWPVAVLARGPELGEAEKRRAERAAARAVAAHNERVEPELRIARTLWTNERFTAENGLLTRNLKLDRTAIRRRFEGELLEIAR